MKSVIQVIRLSYGLTVAHLELSSIPEEAKPWASDRAV